MAKKQTVNSESDPASDKDRFLALSLVTNTHDVKKEDILALREILRDANLARHVGNLSIQAQDVFLKSYKMTPYASETVEAGLDQTKKDLGYNTAPELERILIECVVMASLRLNVYEIRFAQLSNEDMPLELAAFWEHRITVAQQRLLRASESLARIRNLARRDPILQMNFANQQINQQVITEKGAIK